MEKSTENPSFLLAAQQELLFLSPEHGPATQGVVRLAADVSEASLRSGLEQLVARHEILRTTFVRVAGMRAPQQTIHDQLPPAFSTETLSTLSPLDAALDGLVEAQAALLDTERGPVLSACLVSTPDAGRALVLSAAAACLDAPALLLVLAELDTFASGDRPDGDEPLQYVDYAEWRRQQAAGETPEAAAGRAWWEQDSGDRVPALLFGRPHESSGARERLRSTVAPELAAALSGAAERSHVTEAVFLEGCAHALVARLTGADEVVLAGLTDGRGQQDLAGAVGAYAELVPIRSRPDADTTFAELLDQIRRARGEATRAQDAATADQLARAARAVAGFAFYDVTLSGGLFAGGRLVRLSTRTAPTALELVVYSGGGEIAFEVVYDPAVYAAPDAARIASSYLTLVASAAGDPLQAVGALALLDGAARAEALALADGGNAAVSLSTVQAAFAVHAAAQPEALAVSDGSERLTYRELNAAANRLAHRLGALGAGPGSTVALCLDRSPAALVGLLGILKAGAAFVPLNFEHPRSRLAHQLAEADVAVLVTQESLLERLPPFAAVLCLDRDAHELAAEPEHDPEPLSAPEDVAYVMYTSGSTGLPKGVAVSHANVANYTARMLERLGEGLKFAVVSALSTDLGYTSIFPPLASGGSIHLVPHDVVMDPDAFAASMAAAQIDVLKITPSLLTALLAGRSAADALPRAWLVCGGELFTFELLERIRSLGAGCRILNHYGPTETTIGTCVCEVGAASSWPSAGVPIGRPLANTQAYVVDGAGEPVLRGVTGELWIGGGGVARGYVNRPDETAERFRDDPFSAAPGARVYRTGDRARVLPDGNIEFQGRVDSQVKIRGYRVEPGEIEATLAKHPGVEQAAVVARGGADDRRLVAYVVGSPQPAAAELRSFLADWLPEYMIPSFVAIDALPLTPSGKVDRAALPDETALVDSGRETEYVPPSNEVEHEIAEIWQELLGVERVGVTDDFFALGGHSLLATQMITRIRRRHGDVPLRALFAAPTIARLAEAVGNAPARSSDG